MVDLNNGDDVKKPNYSETAKVAFLKEISEHYDSDVVTAQQISEFIKLKSYAYPHFLFNDKSAKVSWGKYRVRNTILEAQGNQSSSMASAPAAVTGVVTHLTPRRVASNAAETYVPEKNETYVPFGFYTDLKNIIASKIFYPIYITGLSGNGKTIMVEQVCAAIGREMIRVNITKETDETDLIGSYELIDGNTIRREGPVINAMRRGAVLLLDETDYGSERLLCLQPILEGKGFYDKKTGDFIHPAAGFNIIATANTKGKGSDDGRFIGANVLNEAFLERFAITVEQEYPQSIVEKKILLKNFDKLKINDENFADCLISWAEVIRKSYYDGAIDEMISTRRLVHIATAFSIFKSRKKAIELCLNRFDTDNKNALLDLYSKVDANYGVEPTPAVAADLGVEKEYSAMTVQFEEKKTGSTVTPTPTPAPSVPVSQSVSPTVSPQQQVPSSQTQTGQTSSTQSSVNTTTSTTDLHYVFCDQNTVSPIGHIDHLKALASDYGVPVLIFRANVDGRDAYKIQIVPNGVASDFGYIYFNSLPAKNNASFPLPIDPTRAVIDELVKKMSGVNP